MFLEILWKWQVNEIMRFKDASVKVVSGSAVWMANSSYMSQMQDAGDRHKPNKLLMLIIQKSLKPKIPGGTAARIQTTHETTRTPTSP